MNTEEGSLHLRDENRRITIDITDEPASVVCHVCDNGGGIDANNMDKIFDPYFTTKGVSSGTGLGLYINKIIVERHFYGTIEAKNADIGVCIIIRLPIEEDDDERTLKVT